MSSSLLILLLVAVATTSAFAPAKSNVQRSTSGSLSMAPKFDKSTGRWFTDVPEEMEGSSYGPVGSLYRAGPKPFFSRIFNADTYDQAVLKYMAQE